MLASKVSEMVLMLGKRKIYCFNTINHQTFHKSYAWNIPASYDFNDYDNDSDDVGDDDGDVCPHSFTVRGQCINGWTDWKRGMTQRMKWVETRE